MRSARILAQAGLSAEAVSFCTPKRSREERQGSQQPAVMWPDTLLLLLMLVGRTAFRPQEGTAGLFGHLQDMARKTIGRGRFPPEPESLLDEYDFVIVGGGSAGCVLASRLSEHPEFRVLLLEAGGDEGFFTDVPVFASYMQSTDYNWGFSTEPTGMSCLSIQGGRCRWPRGKALGGTSVINYMVHSRGDPRDFDAWASAGNPGWSFAEVERYFRRAEAALQPAETAWHSPLARTFLDAGRQMGHRVHPPVKDSLLGFTPVLSHTKSGTRVSAARAWLTPAAQRSNLHVVRRARVTRIVFDAGRRARAVLFVRSKRKRRVGVRREVILSAGTVSSPHILMLSGVGPREHLERVGIPVVADLPVGNNLHDHVAMGGLVFLVNASVTLVESRLQKPSVFLNYVLRGKGPMTLPGGAEALAYMRTPVAEGPGADIELAFGPGALTGDTGGSIRKGLGLRDDVFRQVYGPYMGRDSWTAVPIVLRPKSRGTVRLRSANPFHWPLLQPNYFQDKRDLWTLVEGIKMVTQLAMTPAFQRYDSRLLSVPIPGCQNLKFASDDYWACTARHLTTSLHHQAGTCKMGNDSDPGAVVDSQLRVRGGVTGLRVVDASIMPTVPAGHPIAAVYMIAEKAAEMIQDDWETKHVIEIHL